MLFFFFFLLALFHYVMGLLLPFELANMFSLSQDLEVKSLLLEAYVKGQQELLYVVPFVAKVLESSLRSMVSQIGLRGVSMQQTLCHTTAQCVMLRCSLQAKYLFFTHTVKKIGICLPDSTI